jgi:hypothetical protein
VPSSRLSGSMRFSSRRRAGSTLSGKEEYNPSGCSRCSSGPQEQGSLFVIEPSCLTHDALICSVYTDCVLSNKTHREYVHRSHEESAACPPR